MQGFFGRTLTVSKPGGIVDVAKNIGSAFDKH